MGVGFILYSVECGYDLSDFEEIIKVEGVDVIIGSSKLEDVAGTGVGLVETETGGNRFGSGAVICVDIEALVTVDPGGSTTMTFPLVTGRGVTILADTLSMLAWRLFRICEREVENSSIIILRVSFKVS